ncbi:threonine synthase [Phanerochaete sordida]|uniref:threonine synthase n=1 Tax=Phanerochaete sordida TaxID=48140 RepID=A0A9P3GEN7_9APHY|nr:threonine synthase [Phanerochaete sordida]
MKYFSTRGGDELLSFEETVLTGLAPDGGLYIPERIPQLPADWRTAWAGLSFAELAVEVLALYIDPAELPRAELRALVDRSYSTFRAPDVTPLRPLHGRTYVLELFHGPTFAFKDVALQLLGNLFEFFLQRRNARKAPGEKRERLTVVGATSGDTGSAAIYGLRNKTDIEIFILHPKGRVSPIQEAQMTTVTDANVHNVAVKGTFDDCQDIVKALFGDKEFNAKHRLGAVNSINWARILAQTVYYFLSYFHLGRQLAATLTPDELTEVKIQYVVPTGNFGDILAGYYAKRMGLPIDKLVVATNSNDILARFWKSGAYEKVDSSTPGAGGATAPAEGSSDGKQSAEVGGVKETLSPAMDILVSSNFERLLWYLAFEALAANDAATRRGACDTVNSWMQSVKTDGRVQVPTKVLELARRDFVAERVTDEQTLETIRSYFESEPSYVADPHTAVGLAAARMIAPHNPPSTVQVVLSTAHPAKFSDAVTRALQGSAKFDFERDVLPSEFRGLLEKERRVIDVEAPRIELVKEVIERFARDEDAPAAAGASV